MSKYLGKRVSYTCDQCGKKFTSHAGAVDDHEDTGIFCSAKCAGEYAAENPPVKLQTYAAWSKANDGACRKFSHVENGSRYFLIRNRPTILRDHGFRCVSGGMMDDCSTATDELDTHGRVIRKTPRRAVLAFIEYHDATECVYYADSLYYGHFVVWIKN